MPWMQMHQSLMHTTSPLLYTHGECTTEEPAATYISSLLESYRMEAKRRKTRKGENIFLFEKNYLFFFYILHPN